MSKLKISENLFLGVNELQRLVKFLDDDGYKRILKSLIQSYGIVLNDSNTNFKVTAKSGTSDTVVINSGIAFDSNLDAILMSSATEMVINNTGVKRWLILSRSVSNYEIGTVSVDVDGSLTGVGTEFMSVLRGQPNFPVKVKFSSSINTGEYEVVSVLSDNTAIISGSFTAESSLQFSVIGTFTPGFQTLTENKEIYEYDSYSISIVDSADIPFVTTDQFILSSIEFDGGGVMTVTDERFNYMFNNNQIKSNSTIDENPLASLISVSTIGGINSVDTIAADFELILEHGYTVTDNQLVVSSSNNIFNIIAGSCNFLGSGNIPDNIFAGWLLVNRKNMKYALISGNVNKAVYIPNIDPTMIENSGNDFIIIPNFLEVEYEVTVSSNVDKPTIPFYFKQSIWNVNSRLRIYAYLPSGEWIGSDSITVSVKYRMIDDSGVQYPFSNLSIAQFINIKGTSETLGNSSFNINLADINPEAKQRNYS